MVRTPLLIRLTLLLVAAAFFVTTLPGAICLCGDAEAEACADGCEPAGNAPAHDCYASCELACCPQPALAPHRAPDFPAELVAGDAPEAATHAPSVAAAAPDDRPPRAAASPA